MTKLFTPFRSNGNRHVHVADVTNDQLARTVNEQSARITALDGHVKMLGRILIAITQEPEAFRYQSGVVSVDMAALEKVISGTQLTVNPTAEGLTLAVIKPEGKTIEVHRIIVPGGVK